MASTLFKAVFFLLCQHMAMGALVSQEQADKNFLGCFELKSCDMDEFILGHPAVSSTTQSDRYLPADCINFCIHFADGAPFYSFAGVAHKTCYCIDSLKKLTPVGEESTCDKTCETGGCYETNKLFAYTLCPHGSSHPPSCSGSCPTHCAPTEEGSAAVCDRIGNCVFGCVDNFCNSPTICETVTGAGLTVAKDSTLVSSLTNITAGLHIFPNHCFSAGGYIRKIEYYGRILGSAYVGVWRKNNTEWIMVWKHKIYGDKEGFQTVNVAPSLDDLNVIASGDCLGVHLDKTLMTVDVTDSTLRTQYTMLYGTDNTAKGAGSYEYEADKFDDGWAEGMTYTMPTAPGTRYGPSVALSLACYCQSTCKGGSCNQQGECSQGCVPGFSGTKCDALCTSGKYGAGCSKGCPTNCNAQASCDPVTGLCLGGCNAGFRGALCDIPCDNYYWGNNCEERCGACKDPNTACDKVTGECPGGCRAGFVKPKCIATCESGFYGDCTTACGNCKNGMACNPITGACEGCATGYMMPTCKCSAGKFGASCDKPCGKCLDGKSCNDDNGHCPFGCDLGFQPPLCNDKCNAGKWGPNCQSSCGACANSEACDVITGKCTGGCGPGYLGEYCDIPCDAGKWGQGCTSECGYCEYSLGYGACRSRDGNCMYGCQGGFGLPECTSCAEGFYGDACLKCGRCKNGAKCNKDGTCPEGCDPGVVHSAGCNEVCPPGTWGDNCKEACGHCRNCDVCSPYDGSCPEGCKPGYKAPTCLEKCPQGYYGADCSSKCGTCKNNAPCTAMGHCLDGCDKDLIPPLCIMSSCRPGIWGASCSNVCGKCKEGASCNLIDGSCPAGCASGWKGVYCDQPSPVNKFAIFRIQQCDAGKWGPLCDKNCGKCKNGDACDSEDGSCSSGCELGYNPPLCEDRCPAGKYGDRCIMSCGKCKGGEVCSDTDGKCANGCAEGFHPPSCISPCDDGWFGDGCTKQCGHCNGGCRYSDGVCTTGCDAGWDGDKCDISLRSSASGLKPIVGLVLSVVAAYIC